MAQAARAFVLRNLGDNRELKLEKVSVADPLDDEVQIEQTAIGVNHIDVNYRKGLYSPGQLPVILGMEACGVVTKVGSNAQYVKVGDKVIYGTGVLGAYTTVRNIMETNVLPMPQGISEYDVLACCMKGLMAHSLLSQVAKIPENAKVVVHGATGGIGNILVQMAKFLKLNVIGTVKNEEEAQYAKRIGCDLVVNTVKENFSKAVLDYTNGVGVNMIYDCLGKRMFNENVRAVAPTGIIACYGDVLGVVDDIKMTDFWEKSILITRPCLATLKAKRAELVVSYATIMSLIKDRQIRPKYSVYKFEDIPAVHTIIEKGQHMGSLIVKV